MSLTPHFSSEEFDCKDGTPYPPEWVESRLKPLCNALERIRAVTGKPMKINSGYRTEAYNQKVGGSKGSIHCQGKAADIVLQGMTAGQLYDAILSLINKKEIPEGGVGVYNSWVHYDQRGHKARWDQRSKK